MVVANVAAHATAAMADVRLSLILPMLQTVFIHPSWGKSIAVDLASQPGFCGALREWERRVSYGDSQIGAVAVVVGLRAMRADGALLTCDHNVMVGLQVRGELGEPLWSHLDLHHAASFIATG